MHAETPVMEFTLVPHLPVANAGAAYLGSFSARDGQGPFTFLVINGKLPEGLALSGWSGKVTGTPQKPGVSHFELLARDVRGRLALLPAQIKVENRASSISISISPSSGSIPSQGSLQFEAAVKGTSRTAVDWSASAGSISTTGNFTAPLVSATTNVVVTATSVADKKKKASAVISVTKAASVSIPSEACPAGTEDATYTACTIHAVNGVAGYTWAVNSGALPGGLTLATVNNQAVISGTPTATGTFSFVLEVTDSTHPTPGTASIQLSIAISPVTSPTSPAPLSGENSYCAKGDAWTGPATDGPAQLPKRCIYTALDGTPSPGAVTTVPSGGNVAAALAAAKCGDTIMLTAGATYPPIMLPAKNCDAAHWITIRSSAPDSALPPEHSRINPSYAGVPSLPDRPAFGGGSKNVMAAIVSPNVEPAIKASTGGVANYYRLGPGLDITRTPGTKINYELVDLHINADHIILDRDWIHGSPLVEETKEGVNVEGSTYIAVINSYMNDFKCIAVKGACTDAKTIGGGDDILPHAEGVWKAYNDFLEASGENIIHGGDLTGNQTPMDLEYRQNHFYKPPSWRTCNSSTGCYIVKNLIELKNASQVLLEGNRMEGSWGGYSQNGFAILFTPRGSWAHDDNITVRYNYISHVGSMMSLDATTTCNDAFLVGGKCPTKWVDAASAGNWSIHDLLFDDVNPATYAGTGTIQMISQFTVHPPLHDIVINHITGVSTNTHIFSLFSDPTNPQPKMGSFAYTNSIAVAGQFNIWSTGGNNPCVVDGNPVTFSRCFTKSTVTGNVIIGWKSSQPAWPAGNVAPSSPTAVFMNFKPSGGDYHVQAQYKSAGTDGKAIGADIDTITHLLTNVN